MFPNVKNVKLPNIEGQCIKLCLTLPYFGENIHQISMFRIFSRAFRLTALEKPQMNTRKRSKLRTCTLVSNIRSTLAGDGIVFVLK